MKPFILSNSWMDDRGFTFPHGEANGYVAIPKTSPLYGINYIDEIFDGIEVHGGLTFNADRTRTKKSFTAIWEAYLRLPDTSDDDEVWILGFDTNHMGDNPTTWSEANVLEEAKALAEQLTELEQTM